MLTLSKKLRRQYVEIPSGKGKTIVIAILALMILYSTEKGKIYIGFPSEYLKTRDKQALIDITSKHPRIIFVHHDISPPSEEITLEDYYIRDEIDSHFFTENGIKELYHYGKAKLIGVTGFGFQNKTDNPERNLINKLGVFAYSWGGIVDKALPQSKEIPRPDNIVDFVIQEKKKNPCYFMLSDDDLQEVISDPRISKDAATQISVHNSKGEENKEIENIVTFNSQEVLVL